MKVQFSEFEAKKQELSCNISVKPIIEYLENLYGIKKTKEIVFSLGLPISFLSNRKNWVSYNFYVAMLKKLVEVTKDEKAPYKASFSMKPKSIFEEFYYATSVNITFISPKYAYKIVLSGLFYKRFTKIGDFEILSSSRDFITVKYKLKEGYKQNKYNCLAIQGFMASTTIAYGLPPAEVEHTHCAAEGYDSCIYKIQWQMQKKVNRFIKLIFLLPMIGLELFFYNKIFNTEHIIITIISYFSILLLFKYFQLYKGIRNTEVFNFERNNSILEAMEKIENDYKEIQETKTRLEERTIYLSIVNEVNLEITTANEFNSLIYKTGKIFLQRLRFEKGLFFQYNSKDDKFKILFKVEERSEAELDIIDKVVTNIKKDDILVKKDEYLSLLKEGYSFSTNNIKNKKLSEEFLNWVNSSKSDRLHLIPIEVEDIYSGFFCFVSKKESIISKGSIKLLFENISGQLRVGYQKISSLKVIENILSSIPAFVIIFNESNFEIRYVNDIFINSFPFKNKDHSRENIINKSVFSVLLFGDTFKKNITKSIKSISLGETPEVYENNIGSIVMEYSLFAIPQYEIGEELIGIIITDISEARTFQQKLFINEKLLALGRVASGIAHEINNPLYAVLSNAEEISDNKKADKQTKEYAEEIIDHVMNVSNIIRDLSSYSKTLRKEEHDNININNVIDESLKLVKYSSNFLEVEIKKDLSSIPMIKAAKGEMQQIFINIFSNAIQTMDGRGILRVTTNYHKNYIDITIADTGKGIAKKDIPHIFDLFYTTKKADEGTGQGLHIVKKILDIYNGKIDVQSWPGKGTTFFVKLPLRK